MEKNKISWQHSTKMVNIWPIIPPDLLADMLLWYMDSIQPEMHYFTNQFQQLNKWIDASNPSLCRFVPCEKCKRTSLVVSMWTNANPAAGNHKKICSVHKNGQYALKWCKGQQVPFVHQNDSYSILSLIFSHQMLLVIMEILKSFLGLGIARH